MKNQGSSKSLEINEAHVWPFHLHQELQSSPCGDAPLESSPKLVLIQLQSFAI